VRVAADLERSMLLKLGPQPAAAQRLAASADLQALVEAVAHDHSLLRERVRRLTGAAGLVRLDAALSGVRAAVAAEHASAPVPAPEPVPLGGLDGGTSHNTDSPPPSPRLATAIGPATPEKTPSRRPRPGNGDDSGVATPGGSGGGAPRRQLRPLDVASPAIDSTAGGDAQTGIPDGAEGRLVLVWELLHDPAWRLPSADMEAAWDDAVGRSSVMAVRLSTSMPIYSVLYLAETGQYLVFTCCLPQYEPLVQSGYSA